MKKTPWQKEWDKMAKAEGNYLKQGAEKKSSFLNELLEDKVPDKLRDTLDAAFNKAFFLVFEKGTNMIEKTYQRDTIERKHLINKYALNLDNDKKSLKAFSKEADISGSKNILISGTKGVGLGVLGIGIPDIPIFVGLLLKSIYEIALEYGYSYESTEEKYFILSIIEGALSYGSEQIFCNQQVNNYIAENQLPPNYNQGLQITTVSKTLSTEVLCMKFLQGIPIVGVIGGLSDAVFMQKILKYAKLKYQRRFLFDLKFGKK